MLGWYGRSISHLSSGNLSYTIITYNSTMDCAWNAHEQPPNAPWIPNSNMKLLNCYGKLIFQPQRSGVEQVLQGKNFRNPKDLSIPIIPNMIYYKLSRAFFEISPGVARVGFSPWDDGTWHLGKFHNSLQYEFRPLKGMISLSKPSFAGHGEVVII